MTLLVRGLVSPDRLLQLVNIGLLCCLAAMIMNNSGNGPDISNKLSPFKACPQYEPCSEPVTAVTKVTATASNDSSIHAVLATLSEELHMASVNVPAPFIYGSILADSDSSQIRDMKIRALEPGLSAAWLQRLQQCCVNNGGSVLDVGAHFGYYTLLGTSMGCSFIAVEPVPRFRTVLEMNLRLNGKAGMGTVLPYAVGLEAKTIHMQVPTTGVLGRAHVVGASTGDEVIPVEQRPLDTMLANMPFSNICMMKIDVEGWEPEVIFSAAALLKKTPPQHIMLEFSPGYKKTGLADMLKTLHELGYNATEIGWDKAKALQPVSQIDVNTIMSTGADISTDQSREALIASASTTVNTNVWFSTMR